MIRTIFTLKHSFFLLFILRMGLLPTFIMYIILYIHVSVKYDGYFLLLGQSSHNALKMRCNTLLFL
nr:MAG TPA: hypothetical protein [Caudoviricetes sp.]